MSDSMTVQAVGQSATLALHLAKFGDRQARVNSKDIAVQFDKNHKDVLRAIRNLIAKSPDLGRVNFAPFKINDLTGESTSHYEMDRDGFILLIMGFTGKKALACKLAYIQEFNRMGAALRTQPQPHPIPGPELLRQALLLANDVWGDGRKNGSI